jgi:hypothetical protein
MKTSLRVLLAFSAPALLALAGCQTSPDSGSSSYDLAQEQDAALRAASDSLGVPRPPREVACATLESHLATLDSTAPNFEGLSQAVSRVCRLLPPPHPRPDSTKPRLDSAARAALCDSLTIALAAADSTDSTFAALARRKALVCGEVPPMPRPPHPSHPPRPDTLRPDTVKPHPAPPPKPPRPDSVRADSGRHDSVPHPRPRK